MKFWLNEVDVKEKKQQKIKEMANGVFAIQILAY